MNAAAGKDEHCLPCPCCSSFWIHQYFSILHNRFLKESLNVERGNQLWKMNIKCLRKVQYINWKSPRVSRYYLSILYWFYMPVYSSKQKDTFVTLATWLCYLQHLSQILKAHIVQVNLDHCRNFIYSVVIIDGDFLIYAFKLFILVISVLWLSFQDLILVSYDHNMTEELLLN